MSRPHQFPVDPAWQAVVADLGVRPADVLRGAGLPEDLLARPDAGLDTDAYFRFWESLERLAGGDVFPIRLAEAAVTAGSFMPPVFSVLCSPNLRIGMGRLAHYKRLCAPMRVDLAEGRDRFRVSFHWLDAQVRPPASLGGMEVAFVTALVRAGTRERIEPLRVTTPVVPARADAYAAHFGVPIEAGPHVALEFAAADAERPFLTANERIWETFEPDLRRRLDELTEQTTVAERVRVVLLEALPSGLGTMDVVARRLGMSRRTLQRRLGEEDTRFQTILARTREELARHYLARTQLSAPEISFLLGFEDPNSFFRAFRRWTGATPESVRRASLQ